MAIKNSTLYTSQTDYSKLNPLVIDISGKMRMASIPISDVGALAKDDKVCLVKLKVGARVLPSYSKVVAVDSNLANTVTLSLGNAETADKYGTLVGAEDLNAAFNPSEGNAYPDRIESGDEDIYLTVSAALASGTGEVVIHVAYLDE